MKDDISYMLLLFLSHVCSGPWRQTHVSQVQSNLSQNDKYRGLHASHHDVHADRSTISEACLVHTL